MNVEAYEKYLERLNRAIEIKIEGLVDDAIIGYNINNALMELNNLQRIRELLRAELQYIIY